MNTFTSIATFFIVWWMTLFALVSLTGRSQADTGERVIGTEPSAPERPRLLRLVLLNTLVSGVIFAIWYVAVTRYGFGLSSLSAILPAPPR